ncbi:hypothetical protein TSA6c_00305 [Azospirillum sp. TSA6c]|uniref:siphovirus Gp157 family protein n=1 Tax=Azospirillum sp. TSA6c TaxID=709813 RepID=UPI000D61C9BA|nr:siphovirus Gp157 family protein [Azospirillum sp. TSA6c]PWC54404.1 hypothetical protein TSA6c_00305 [Azospirillum sp. TSA6c]
MNAVQKLTIEARKTNAMRDTLLRMYPALAEDERALFDTLEGVTDMETAVASVLEKIEEYEGMAASLGDQIEVRKQRKDRLLQSCDTMRAAIVSALEMSGIKRVMLPEGTVSVSAGRRSVVVTDEQAAMAAGFVRTKQELDKSKIGEALRNGQTLPFAVMSNGAPSLSVRRA